MRKEGKVGRVAGVGMGMGARRINQRGAGV